MTAETLDDSVDELPAKKGRGKKMMLFIILPLLILSGGGAGLYVTGIFDMLLGGGEEPHAEAEEMDEHAGPPEPGIFFDIPDILVNLNAATRDSSYLKLSVSLELGGEEDIVAIERVMPRINDNFQVYLRQMRLQDLHGSAGLYRLKEELLRRIRTAASDVDIRDVLVREMLVQ